MVALALESILREMPYFDFILTFVMYRFIYYLYTVLAMFMV